MSQDHVTRPSLLLRVRDRQDDTSWVEFVEIYGPLIHRFALSRGVSKDDAPDITQDVLRNVSNAMQAFEYDREKGKFRSWLFTITRREIIRAAKKAGRRVGRPLTEDPTPMIDQLPSDYETANWDKDYQQQLTRWAMDKIRPDFSDLAWNAFTASAVDGVPAPEAARRLGTSTGTIYVLKSRILKRLLEVVRGVDDDSWEIDAISKESATDR